MATIITCFRGDLRTFADLLPAPVVGAGNFAGFDGEGMRCGLESGQAPDEHAA
jgi:hypothetical protein